MVTREHVLDRIAALGPLQNVFLVAEDKGPLASIVIWYPEIGFRGLIIENDALAWAIYDYLREAGVRRFKSDEELAETQRNEKWKGWDTCEDYRRMLQAAEELARRGKK
jgi:hypothetical protein